MKTSAIITYYHCNAEIMRKKSDEGRDNMSGIFDIIKKAASNGFYDVQIINNVSGVQIHFDTVDKLIELGYKVTQRYCQPYWTKEKGNDSQETVLTINW